MEQQLNISRITTALASRNFSYSDVASRLQVSLNVVEEWFSGLSTPVPHRLLRLSHLLDLPFDDLVVKEEVPQPAEPVVAYRKIAGKVTTDTEVEKARVKGRLLRALVPYLSNQHIRPASLKDPSLDYDYLQEVVADLRVDLGLTPFCAVEPNNFISKFKELGAVLVPVMWGKREAHGNALHILLPDSGATWVFVNIDANVCDFNFWMAHELAHVLTPQLSETNEGEDFADAFAQTLLFPKACAAELYAKLSGKNTGTIVNLIKAEATKRLISPFTIFKAINSYAEASGLADFSKIKLYGAVRNFEKDFFSVKEFLFGEDRPEPSEYVSSVEKAFETSIFDLVRRHLHDSPDGPAWLAEAFEISFLDAKGLYEALLSLPEQK